MTAKADREGLEVVKVFQESKSAFKVGRPVFDEMLRYIEAGNAEGVLCWKIDRLSRNSKDGGYIQWLLQERTIESIITIDSVHLPEDNALILSLQGSMANQYSRDLSANVKRGNLAKLKGGLWPGLAPYGYTNDQSSKVVVQDTECASHIIYAFKAYAKNSVSLSELCSTLNNRGMRSRSGRPMSTSSLHNVLTNPFYYGLMRRSEGDFIGKHKALISEKLWQEVQEVMSNGTVTKSEKNFYTYRDFLTCGRCHCAYTSDTKKGKYVYYYCTNGKKVCDAPRKYLSRKHVDEKIAGIFDDLIFDKELIEIMYQAAIEKEKHDKGDREVIAETLERQLQDLTSKEEELLDTFLAKRVPEDLYDRKMKEITAQKSSLGIKLSQKHDEGRLTFEQTKKIFLAPHRAKKEFLNQNDRQKRKTLENLLSNAQFKDGEIAYIRYKQPFQMLSETPKNGSLPMVLGRRDSNPRYTGSKPDALPLGYAPRCCKNIVTKIY